MSWSEGEDSVMLSVSRHRARKEHVCCECVRTIQKREHYWAYHGLWDGRWRTHCRCDDCHRLSELVERYLDWNEGVVFGALHEAAMDLELI